MLKKIMRPSWVVLAIVVLALLVLVFSGSSDTEKTSLMGFDQVSVQDTGKTTFKEFKNAEENEGCFKCHGQSKYSYENSESGKTVTRNMYAELIIDRQLFYESNHREFKCVDCHSEDYGTFPHAGNLRMEAMPNCIDCHGGDEKYAKFHFESIDTGFMESVHSEKHSDDFTCWMCHDAHTYKIVARTNEVIKKTIAYDNAICLDCHGNITKYQLLTNKRNPNLIVKHEWLPNQILHFQSVRCIECHTKKVNDSTLIAHKILPKNQAVKLCIECHSNNSILMASLYKYQVKEVRTAKGFFTSVFTGESYAIGANRNFYLNMISLIIAGFVLLGIIGHAILRIIK